MIEIPKNVLARIWVMAKNAGMDKKEFYRWTWDEWGKNKLHDFTQKEINELVDCLKKMQPGQPRGRINNAQRDLIYYYAVKLVRDRSKVDKYIQSTVRNVAKVDSIEWLTPRLAIKVIEALKAAYKRKRNAKNA